MKVPTVHYWLWKLRLKPNYDPNILIKTVNTWASNLVHNLSIHLGLYRVTTFCFDHNAFITQ